MKHSTLAAFALGLLALGFAAVTPARADFTVIQFGNGYCQVWWDSANNPWGTGWTKLEMGLPNYPAAQAALDSEIVQGACR
jgi:hypothetical protein